MSEKQIHIPVLLNETIEGLAIKPEGIYVDCTTGFAGHSREIAKRLDGGRLIGFDRDPDAVKFAEEVLKPYNHILINKQFSLFSEALSEIGVEKVDGVLMDLGVSSYQLDTAERGFSYHEDAPLDMRMSKSGLSAYDVVNEYPAARLEKILFEYGEEKFARGIVSGIIKQRELAPIETTLQLAEIIKRNVPLKVRKEKNPCKKTFQAIRIEVNGELDELVTGLDSAFAALNKGGRLAVITFHSIEDRIVKNKFKEYCTGCTCPPSFPVCVCGKTPEGALVNKKPIIAGDEELSVNVRSRSAKLRVIEKL
ncbi:MAG: 16S rRNA (cytosine(1402)-N(4))-methyltransferase RsmH [Ruminiclostridium sp.]|nr:16S rRNA (cytosine(1402)-N(4))-methyltransferase RsmH [Ruminiclostridium sp.]